MVEQLDEHGAKTYSNVFSNGGEWLAKGASPGTTFLNFDPVTSVEQDSSSNALDAGRSEIDPLGADVGTYNIYEDFEEPDRDFPFHSAISGPADGCIIDGLPGDCKSALLILISGAGVRVPPGTDTTSRMVRFGGHTVLAVYRAYWDGFQGFVPLNADYGGNGNFSLIGSPVSQRVGPDTDFSRLNHTGNNEQDLLYVPEFPQNTSDHEFAHSRVRCPPTREQLAKNPVVQKALNEAFQLSKSSRVERGGWIYWNKRSNKVFTIIKDPPTINPLNPKAGDTYLQVYLSYPPSPPKGWAIVGDFHTHPEDVGPDDWDEGNENNLYRVPGIVQTPNRSIPYGPNRGIWKSDLPAGCK